MEARKLGIAVLVLVGIITASFVVAEMKDGLNAGNADASSLGGNTLYVGGSGPNNYTKIQDAINDANDGDTVFVYSGTYYENVVVDKSINLIGEDRITTIIDGGGHGDVVLVDTNHVQIMNFTITNGGGEYFESGVFMNHVDECTVSYCDISGNNGFGIFLMWSNGNIVTNNIVNSNGMAGIRVDVSSNTITQNTIKYNVESGIFLYDAFNVTIVDNAISHNDNGIDVEGSSRDITIHENVIQDNSNYGIFFYESRTSSIIQNQLIENRRGTCIEGDAALNYGNIIYHNCYIDNRYTSLDTGDNTYDYEGEGNYWSNFDEANEGAFDEDDNGIADTPYKILRGNNQDRYPLMYPYPDTLPPSVDIIRPENYLYIFDIEIMPMDKPIILGKITVNATATDESGIKRVEFYVDNQLKYTATNESYTWEYNLFSFGRHALKVVAWDKACKTTTEEMDITIFNI